MWGGARKEVCTRPRTQETLGSGPPRARARTPVTAFSNTMRLMRRSLAWRLATANRRGVRAKLVFFYWTLAQDPTVFLSFSLPFSPSRSLLSFSARRCQPTSSRLAPPFPSLFPGPETPPSPSSPTTISTSARPRPRLDIDIHRPHAPS